MEQKFLDKEGVKVLWNQVSLKDYPNNETLMAVIDAIDETKADKDELFSKSWNDLEDRPFGEETQDTVYLPETTLNDFRDSDIGYYYTRLDSDIYSIPPALKIGTKYTVIYDGIIYENLECSIPKWADIGYIGNGVECSGDYPFGIHYQSGEDISRLVFEVKDESTTTHTFEIIEHGTIVKQLDEKFIPDSLKLQSNLSQNDETQPDYVKGRTHWQDDDYSVWDGYYFYELDLENNNPGWHYIKIEDGQKYKVTINEEVYEGIVKRPYGGYGSHIGNDYLLDYSQNGIYDDDLSPKDTGEPFVIYINNQSYDEVEGAWQSHLYFYFEEGFTVYDGGFNLQLEQIVEGDIHQLDEKFIPDTISRVNHNHDDSYSKLDHTHSWNELTDKPFGECDEMIIDSYEHTFKTYINDYDDRELEESLCIDGGNFVDTFKTGEIINVLWNDKLWEAEVLGDGVLWLNNEDGERVVTIVLPTSDEPNFWISPEPYRYDPVPEEFIVTFSLYRKNTGIATLDEQFIPDTIQRTFSVLTQANTNSLDNSYSPVVDSDLATKGYVDSFAPTEIDAMALLMETGFIDSPVTDNGYIFTDENGAIYTF